MVSPPVSCVRGQSYPYSTVACRLSCCRLYSQKNDNQRPPAHPPNHLSIHPTTHSSTHPSTHPPFTHSQVIYRVPPLQSLALAQFGMVPNKQLQKQFDGHKIKDDTLHPTIKKGDIAFAGTLTFALSSCWGFWMWVGEGSCWFMLLFPSANVCDCRAYRWSLGVRGVLRGGCALIVASAPGSGPDSRTCQLWVARADSDWLGKAAWETPVARIATGMAVIDNLHEVGDLEPWGRGGGRKEKRANPLPFTIVPAADHGQRILPGCTMSGVTRGLPRFAVAVSVEIVCDLYTMRCPRFRFLR